MAGLLSPGACPGDDPAILFVRGDTDRSRISTDLKKSTALFATKLVVVALLAMTSTVAFAQIPTNAGTATPMHPGHEIGVGESSQPDKVGTISARDTTPVIAPILPSPAIDNDAAPRDYLRAARAALVAGRTGEAQQSLEMAETRELDHMALLGHTDDPSAGLFLDRIIDARRALDSLDTGYAITLVDVALLH
jgi:hypothetical protein